MPRLMIRAFSAAALVAAIGAAVPAGAQDGSPPNFFDRMFGRPDRPAVPATGGQAGAAPGPDHIVQIERLEAQVRQLTGMVEQLQHRNRQLELQLRQGETGAQPGGAPQTGPAQSGLPPQRGPVLAAPAPSPSAVPGRRRDVFDPAQNPDAPGVPRPLGSLPGDDPPQVATAEPPVGAPGGRGPGAPLDLSTLATGLPAGTAADDPPQTAAVGALPPPPSRNLSATGATPPVAPPSDSPRDYYDLAYGYVLRKDFALAEESFDAFLTRFPNDRRAADARYWLGESRFQRQRYDEAASAFLDLSTKHGTHPRAPDALLRLGQSLAALQQTEMACATLAEIGRKYPRASSTVKQGVEREQKRVRC